MGICPGGQNPSGLLREAPGSLATECGDEGWARKGHHGPAATAPPRSAQSFSAQVIFLPNSQACTNFSQRLVKHPCAIG